jgi:hypothetical protein
MDGLLSATQVPGLNRLSKFLELLIQDRPPKRAGIVRPERGQLVVRLLRCTQIACLQRLLKLTSIIVFPVPTSDGRVRGLDKTNIGNCCDSHEVSPDSATQKLLNSPLQLIGKPPKAFSW